MKWSWRLGKFAGIDVYVHATFILLLLWIALMHWMAGHSAETMLSGIVFMLALFGSVLLHEFGHALTAKAYGIGTRDITLLPIGGISRMERMPEKPRQELAVALAGPGVNVAIAAALLVFSVITNTWVPLDKLALTQGSLAERVLLANISLLFFNLIASLSRYGPGCRVADAMRRDYRTIDSSEALESVFMRIGATQDYAIPVTQSGRLVGLLTSDNVAEFFMLHTALEQSRHRKQPQAA